MRTQSVWVAAGVFGLCGFCSLGLLLYRTFKSVNEPDVASFDRVKVADMISMNVGTKVRVDNLLYVNRDDSAYLFHGDALGIGKHSELVHFGRVRAMDGMTIFIAVWSSTPSELKQGVSRAYSQLERFGVSSE